MTDLIARREAVARIIDPDAWERRRRHLVQADDCEYPDHAGQWEVRADDAVKASFAKADAILAALSNTPSEERVCANEYAPLNSPIPELRSSLLARAIRHSLRSYGHKVAESSLPECIARDVEQALRRFATDTVDTAPSAP